MGCTFAKRDRGDNNPRIFRVFNVDDQGQVLRGGNIEITDNDLILHQKSKDYVTWPLRSLRRYGFDAELFSFESGRRCPTGPGIYAFKCSRAEALFNLLQESIQKAGQEEHNMRNPIGEGNSRPGSLVALQYPNGDLSPGLQLHSLHPDHSPQHQYVNGDIATESRDNNSRHDSIAHEYVNTPVAVGGREHRLPLDANAIQFTVRNPSVCSEGHVINYAVLDLPKSREDVNQDGQGSSPLHKSSNGSAVEVVELDPVSSQATYVNVPPAESTKESSLENLLNGVSEDHTGIGVRHHSFSTSRQVSKDDQHSYANLDLLSANSTPKFRDGTRPRKVNYIQLDLKGSQDNISNGVGQAPSSPISVASSNLESPSRKTESYVTIDFHKTAALNTKTTNSEDEGFRKTRHNSNIDDLN